MLYQINDGIKEITVEDIDSEKQVIGLITLNELELCYEKLGFSPATLSQCQDKRELFRNSIDSYGDYSFGMFNIINVKSALHGRDRVGFYLKKNLFLLVDVKSSENIAEKMFSRAMEKITSADMPIEKVIYIVLETIISDDYITIEKMEFENDSLEEKIAKGKADDSINNLLLSKKKKLLVLHNYYEQLISVAEELMENNICVFSNENIFYFKLFRDRVSRLNNDINMIREGLVQIREAYTSSVDLSINRVMRMLTVVATIFMPLTLITGWYGMNFSNMPELSSEYGYIIVSVVSAIIIVVCVLVCKRKKFF